MHNMRCHTVQGCIGKTQTLNITCVCKCLLLQGLSSSKQLSSSDLLLAGGLGGTAFWAGCYPLGECLHLEVHATNAVMTCHTSW
jgi:hypothetical protein